MKPLAEWFWTDRWDGSSAALLPLEARGLYREMLTQAWRRGARLPSNVEAIKRAVRCTDEEWARCWPLVKPYWVERDGWLTNETQVEVWEETRKQMEARSSRGAAAARKRWQCSSNARALPEHMLGQSLGNALRSPDLDLSPDQSQDQKEAPSESCPQERTVVRKKLDLPPFALMWNEEVAGSSLSLVRVWSAARDRVLKARLAEEGDLEVWRGAIKHLLASQYHTGGNDRGWKADVDFLLQPGQAPKWLDKARSGPPAQADPEITPQLRRLMGGA